MKKYVHLNFEDRTVIEALIRLGYSCKNIAKELSRSESTIRREIKNNRTMTKPNLFNNYSPGYCGCSSRYPYVCNNCPMKNGNKVYKYFYTSTKAQENYELSLSFSRTGSNFDNQTMKRIDAVVVDGLSKNQSVYHIIEANSLPVSVSSIYRWVKEGLLSPKPIDLRKAIKYRTKDSRPKRAKNAVNRRDRTYKDYLIYVSDNPSVNMLCFAIAKYIVLQRKVHNVATQYFPFNYSILDKAFFKR